MLAILAVCVTSEARQLVFDIRSGVSLLVEDGLHGVFDNSEIHLHSRIALRNHAYGHVDGAFVHDISADDTRVKVVGVVGPVMTLAWLSSVLITGHTRCLEGWGLLG